MLLQDAIIENQYNRKKLYFLEDFRRLPLNSDMRWALYFFEVTGAVFRFERDFWGWLNYSWFLFLKTECGFEIWLKQTRFIIGAMRHFRLTDFLYYFWLWIVGVFYLPIFLFKFRKLKKKWNPFFCYLYVTEDVEVIRKEYLG